jgi:quercetin dioxygenase-like cupin family protein
VAAKNPARRRAPGPQASARAAAAKFVPSARLPWFPFLSEGIHLKLLRVNPSTGEMVLVIRVQPGAGLGTHYHHGVVVAYTISGRWRYRDADWVAGPGDAIIEPAGSTRAFETVGEEAAESFVHLTGALEFRDEAGKTLCIENAETLHGRYLAHCALHGIEPVDVTAF